MCLGVLIRWAPRVAGFTPLGPSPLASVSTLIRRKRAYSPKIKKKIDFRHPNIRKHLGFRILVKSLQYKGEVRNSKFEKLIELYRVNVTGVYARSCYIYLKIIGKITKTRIRFSNTACASGYAVGYGGWHMN